MSADKNKIVPIPTGQAMFSKIDFTFTDDWGGTEKIAQFVQGKNIWNIAMEGTSCFVPAEVCVGYVDVFMRGYVSGSKTIATANGVRIPVVQGARTDGETPVPPTPDLYAQLLEKVNEAAASAAPYIGENGNWFVYDAELGGFVDSSVRADFGTEAIPVYEKFKPYSYSTKYTELDYAKGYMMKLTQKTECAI